MSTGIPRVYLALLATPYVSLSSAAFTKSASPPEYAPPPLVRYVLVVVPELVEYIALGTLPARAPVSSILLADSLRSLRLRPKRLRAVAAALTAAHALVSGPAVTTNAASPSPASAAGQVLPLPAPRRPRRMPLHRPAAAKSPTAVAAAAAAFSLLW